MIPSCDMDSLLGEHSETVLSLLGCHELANLLGPLPRIFSMKERKWQDRKQKGGEGSENGWKGEEISDSIAGIQTLANELSQICTPKSLLLQSEIQCTDMQIKYNLTKLNHSSYFVNIFQSLFTFFNIHTQIFTPSISPRSCRDSIFFVYSCFIPTEKNEMKGKRKPSDHPSAVSCWFSPGNGRKVQELWK